MRILLTGMSGTGKSTVIGELAARGYRAVDIDSAGWLEQSSDGGWDWQEDRVRAFLATPRADAVFLSGCAANQWKFYPQFDHIVLLSAPAEVIRERLAVRTNNPYGKQPNELAAVLRYLGTVEPRLRESATLEIDTRAPVADVVARVLELVESPPE